MIFQFVEDHRNQYRVNKMCEVLLVSTSGYYKWREKNQSDMQKKKEGALKYIQQIFFEYREVYGSPRIHKELDKIGMVLSEKTVGNYMRELGLCATMPSRYTVTTKSNSEHLIYPNLLNRNFNTDEPNKVWVVDITYIWTSEGWLYLATVMDLFSRKIIGFNLDKSLSKELPRLALVRAFLFRQPEEGLVHHSDQGCQYTSNDYIELLKEKKCEISMSRRGDCFDNACIESFHATIKKELIYRRKFKTRDEAERTVLDYIVSFYNEKRSHSTLNYTSPNQFELMYQESIKKNAQKPSATIMEEQLAL
ncbi:IS3 family transposase [Sporosarcina oncorhynchi]|uniref:IS3 family transposase n=1 Tax=Sporosarcina oncorhynchi TaxID=3056444 RepID=A0ABZ0L5B3_9BACL|nr:IS3 family transposase [Sporosarcina sp. T2O-4]WOV87660.1 IS3 family transposase [Sporosarcina sp. T2O-4]WOV87733.1 IS3 family transposase [Sporosarcina sp. T2O-4]